MEGVIRVIKYARENKIAFLATCGGFQHTLIEYFRNVIGYNSADSLEIKADSEMPVINQLKCSLVEKEEEIFLKSGSRVREFCNAAKLIERFHCNYGFNPEYIDLLNKSKLKISGVDVNKEVRVVELVEHPFFISTLFQPERSALLNKHHPIINEFVNFAALLS